MIEKDDIGLALFLKDEKIYDLSEKEGMVESFQSFEGDLIILTASLGDQEREMMGKTLKSIKKENADYILIEMEANEKVRLGQFLHKDKKQTILIFGLAPSKLFMNIEAQLNIPTEFYGQQFLWTLSLADISKAEYKQYKMAWWMAMKQMFGV